MQNKETDAKQSLLHFSFAHNTYVVSFFLKKKEKSVTIRRRDAL